MFSLPFTTHAAAQAAVHAAMHAAVPASAATSGGFLPHGYCFLWNRPLLWTHITSDALIGGSYVTISVTLAALFHRIRRDVPFSTMFVAFGLFIVTCGLTHFMSIWTLWQPVYWLDGAVKAVTAVASVSTAAVLPFVAPRVRATVGDARRARERDLAAERARAHAAAREAHVAELEALTARLQAQADELEAANAQLQDQAAELEEQAAELEHQTEQAEAAAAALAVSEARLQAIIDSAPAAIYVKDLDGRNVLANAGLERVLGRPRTEIVGRTDDELFAPALAERFRANDAAVLAEGRTITAEEDAPEPDGTVRTYLSAKFALRDPAGVVYGVGGISTDITDRKRAEAARDASEARYRAFVDAAPQLAWSNAPDGTPTFFNARWFEYTGQDARDVVAARWADVVYPDDLAGMREVRARGIASGAPYELEVRLRRRDGAYRWFLARVVPLRGVSGDGPPGPVLGWYGAALDVDARRRAEDAMVAANAELAQTTSTIAHDLRSPLRALHGYSAMLERDYAARLDARGVGYLARVQANAVRMGHLIDGVLALAKLGRTDFAREAVDLGVLARATAEELAAADPGRRAEVRIADGLTAVGDPRLLALVVQNLVGNAWKFTRDRDPAVLEVGRGQPADGADPEEAGGGASTFFVRDNGVGFDPEHAGQLFRPFQRLHSEAEFEGTGIGLATVRRVVERHGGRVWATSIPDGGTTVYFTLPARSPTDLDR